MSESLADLLRRGLAIQRNGGRAMACLVVKARGSTPQSDGALMLVDECTNSHGTIGGGCVEAEVRQRAFRMLNAGQSGLMRFKLDHDYGWDDGLICGGTLELAVAPLPGPEVLSRILDQIEQRLPTALALRVQTDEGPASFTLPLLPRERLYIAGAGHVGQALARLALRLEFDVTVFDDRADYLDRYAPEGAGRCPGPLADRLAEASVDQDTYCVIVTRGHRHDEQALSAVLGRGARYVGMIGSRRKVTLLYKDLIERGVPEDQLQRVHAPIGLDIGAVTVEEIALAIAAEIVRHRRSTRPAPVEGPNPAGAGAAAGEGS